jgi:hypothetical protein
VIALRTPGLIVVAQSQVYGETARHLPIVLEEQADRVARLALPGVRA